ncbi:MAG: hypothetical protein HZB75_01700 [Candidatus Saccharibacteria bacterium]|nr:MAG: hypothetical protein HZB75_01700 [Candidatus Saccharibacteria bacterium]
MTVKQKSTQLPWRLILILGSFALIRPIIKIFGDIFGYSVPPIATVLITVAIAIIWIGVIIHLKVKKPMVVLAMSGVVYAVLSIAMAVLIQLLAPDLGDEKASVAVLLTAGLIATTSFNFVYGAFLGLIASMIQKISRR